jgi:hypothetical protein
MVRNLNRFFSDHLTMNVLRGAALDRKNWLFADSDTGGEWAAALYLLSVSAG